MNKEPKNWIAIILATLIVLLLGGSVYTNITLNQQMKDIYKRVDEIENLKVNILTTLETEITKNYTNSLTELSQEINNMTKAKVIESEVKTDKALAELSQELQSKIENSFKVSIANIELMSNKLLLGGIVELQDNAAKMIDEENALVKAQLDDITCKLDSISNNIGMHDALLKGSALSIEQLKNDRVIKSKAFFDAARVSQDSDIANVLYLSALNYSLDKGGNFKSF